ncbi:hypothetical protein GQ55_5G193400 [Panicum hallii var. hallii]|uniref:Uncharacterized protein n=1 Tax=Panicum hallii var. hallii TaxID=1504633 RepID=A0A2T7DHZ1_9POAL|nr:hypothetical protein GQ55_5G193400 [Panicum hallii var. hallii]
MTCYCVGGRERERERERGECWRAARVFAGRWQQAHCAAAQAREKAAEIADSHGSFAPSFPFAPSLSSLLLSPLPLPP